MKWHPIDSPTMARGALTVARTQLHTGYDHEAIEQIRRVVEWMLERDASAELRVVEREDQTPAEHQAELDAWGAKP